MAEISKKKFDATVLKTESVAQGVKKITFKIDKPFSFFPGQYVWVELLDMDMVDPRGSRRAFSIFNTINGDNTIEIVARISESGYKQSLFALAVNDKVAIHGPFGYSFVVDEKHQPENIIMIAGGVGISAFLSKLWTIRDKGYASKCYLVYLNKDENTTPFLAELKDLKESTDFFDFKNKYEYFSWADVKDVSLQMKGEIEWWVSGSQGMVDHVFNELESGGVSVQNMVFENFYPTNKLFLTRESVEKQMSSDNIFLIAIENSTNHTVLTDPNGVIVFANKAAESTTGYSKAEILGNTPRLWGGMMDSQFYVDFWKSKKSGNSFVGGLTNRHKNGNLYYSIAHIAPILNKDNVIIGYIGTEEDITDVKNKELEIRASEEKFKSLVVNVPGTFYRCKLDKDWTMLFLTPEISALSGYSVDEIIGEKSITTYAKLILPEDSKYVEDEVQKAVDSNKSWEIEYRIKNKNGSVVWCQEKGRAVLDEKGGVIYLDGVIMDISSRKKEEEKLRELNKNLEQINKFMVDRELKMIELKNKIRTLELNNYDTNK